MAIYKVEDSVLKECKKVLVTYQQSCYSDGEFYAWLKKRRLNDKRALKLIKLLEENYYV